MSTLPEGWVFTSPLRPSRRTAHFFRSGARSSLCGLFHRTASSPVAGLQEMLTNTHRQCSYCLTYRGVKP